MSSIILTMHKGGLVKGGVETYTRYLLRVFPDSEVVSVEDCVPMTTLPFLGEPVDAFRIARRFVSILDSKSIDFVIANGLVGWPFRFWRSSVNDRLVCVFHGNYAGYADATLPHPSLHYLYCRYVLGQFEKWSGQAARYVVSVSESVRDQVAKYYGIKSIVIHNAIDPRSFPLTDESDMCRARAHLQFETKRPIALFVGRPSYAKGFDVFIRMAELCPDVVFLAVTDTEIPKDMAVPQNLISHWGISYDRMPVYYAASNVLIMPSRFEGCSYVILEALASGVPAIVSRTGLFAYGNPIGDGVQVVNGWSTTEYAQALRLTLTSGLRGRRLLPDEFLFPRFQCQYDALRRQILRG